MIRAWATIFLLLCAPAQAQELDVPENARQTAKRSSDLDSYTVPLEVFQDAHVPTYVMEGPVVREVWRIDGGSATALQLLVPLRSQLENAGYDIQLDCSDATCGGFDFRFGVEVLPAPNMVVNLRDYRYMTALRGTAENPVSAITVLVSRTTTAAFIQIIRVGQPKPATTNTATLEPEGVIVTAPVVIGDMTEALTASGHVVLHDLTFQTGSSQLGEGPFETLGHLARFLKDNPGIKVALVGHTDAVGSLSGNIALSKARAQSVAQVLIKDFNIPKDQVEAEGMGYLSPVASNLVQSGREANRRVEVVLLTKQDDDQ